MSPLNIENLIKKTREEFQKSLDWFSKELLAFRGSRLTLNLLYNIPVDYYGSKLSLKEIASLSFSDSNTVSIEPWDKSSIKNIEDALRNSQLGGNIKSEEGRILFSFPSFTQEDREKIVKLLNQKSEKARIVLRQVREKTWDTIQEMEKQGEISEDDKFKGKEKLQELIDKFQEKIEELKEKKTKEITA